MNKSKMLLSCAMMLMFSVSIFAGQSQKDVKKCMMLPQESECQMFFMFDIDMPPHDKCPMFNEFQKGAMKDCKQNHDKDFKKEFKELNLTDKQKEQLYSLQKTTMEANMKLFNEFREKIQAINNELLNEKYNLKNIKLLNKELSKIASKTIDNSINKKKELRNILTFEQYTKLFKHKTKYDILANKLNLSNEQKEKVEKIIQTKENKIKELRNKKHEKEMLLMQELEKDDYNKDNVENLVKEISNISNERLQLKTDTQIELKSVLSAEQYNKLKDCHKKDCMKMHEIK